MRARLTKLAYGKLALVGLASLLAGCTGNIVGQGGTSDAPSGPGDDPGNNPGSPGSAGSAGSSGAGNTPGDPTPLGGLRRLTAYEYDNTLRDLLEDDSRPGSKLLPPDARQPFDNDYTVQVASKALIDGLDLVAREAVTRLFLDTERRDRVLGCEPSGAEDRACFESIVRGFGRRALRRSLSDPEVQDITERFMGLAATAGDFYAAVGPLIQGFLQHPELVYRVEVGTPVAGEPGRYALNGSEVASRLSYFLWAAPPDGALLDAAEAGVLANTAGIRAEGERLLQDPRASEQVARFHALWLGYETMSGPGPALLSDMHQETARLITRVVFEQSAPWLDLFRATDSFMSPTLAEHYGLESSGIGGAGDWVSYAGSERQGILSHATFLSNGAKAGDTSPTLRGLAIRELLMCDEIPPPPPGVDADTPPASQGDAVCKEDRYAVHREGSCAGCHAQMDPVGFGLEQYDQLGRYRTVEADNPDCAISGEGNLEGIGTFSGPRELSELLINTGKLNACVVRQVYRFATGRTRLTAADDQLVASLATRIEGTTSDFRFDELLLELVSDEAFRHRREEQ